MFVCVRESMFGSVCACVCVCKPTWACMFKRGRSCVYVYVCDFFLGGWKETHIHTTEDTT